MTEHLSSVIFCDVKEMYLLVTVRRVRHTFNKANASN